MRHLSLSRDQARAIAAVRSFLAHLQEKLQRREFREDIEATMSKIQVDKPTIKGRGKSRPTGSAITTEGGTRVKEDCVAQEDNVLSQGATNAASKMRETWEQLVVYAATIPGDINKELRSGTMVNIPEPEIPQAILEDLEDNLDEEPKMGSVAKLEQQRSQEYSLVFGQCTKALTAKQQHRLLSYHCKDKGHPAWVHLEYKGKDIQHKSAIGAALSLRRDARSTLKSASDAAPSLLGWIPRSMPKSATGQQHLSLLEYSSTSPPGCTPGVDQVYSRSSVAHKFGKKPKAKVRITGVRGARRVSLVGTVRVPGAVSVPREAGGASE